MNTKKTIPLISALLTGTILLTMTACGKRQISDKNLITGSNDDIKTVNMFTPMEKSNPNADNTARTA